MEDITRRVSFALGKTDQFQSIFIQDGVIRKVGQFKVTGHSCTVNKGFKEQNKRKTKIED